MENMNNLEEFKQYVLKCYPQEAVGIIVHNHFIPMENIHNDPCNYFELSSLDCFRIAELTEEYSIVHSHTMETFIDDPRTPSFEDMQGQNNSTVPWGIVHCDGTVVTDILWFGTPRTEVVLGKNYVSNVDDCFTLARDFYYTNFNVDVGVHPRPADWEEWNQHYILQNYAKLGFTEVKKAEFGDILLFTIASRTVNHIGIFLQEDTFIHHLHGRKSCEDSVSKWNRQLTKIIRYTNGS
jgi:proteasome lid subunit RPN8/RPN11